jgi:hypothetical protein
MVLRTAFFLREVLKESRNGWFCCSSTTWMNIARARAAGAAVVEEPAVHDYGADHWADRSYGALAPEGHLWWFTERLRNPPGE